MADPEFNAQRGLEQLLQAAAEITRAVDDLRLAVLMLREQFMPRISFDPHFDPSPPRRPIEEQGTPLPSIQRDAG